MAKISLRAYNREIETLVDHGNLEQAIAHCRHILSIYNKHIYTYRLLGKAYLESQRFGDAADILQRVLSTLPDDFISQVGMSIIREDEGSLDEAIWHMERAYEVQPANNAIQRELQRLYGKRDGIEPPKIRLTRAALARMYIKGELYEQAIGELRSTQDPITQRPDIYVLLAQVYFLAGKRVDAAQVSNQLLKRLPFCFEANRILTAILTQSDRADEAKSYRQRLIALDPYAAHTSPAAPTPDDVPDSAVSVEKLDWNPDLSPADMLSQPEWASSLGVEIEDDEQVDESLPEWLDELDELPATLEASADNSPGSPIMPEDSQDMELPDDDLFEQTQDDDTIPAWMKDAGWEASSVSDEEVSAYISPDDEEETSPDDLAPADLPDWVQAIAPSEDVLEDKLSSDEELLDIEAESLPVETSALPWLEDSPPGPTDTVSSWLEEKEPQISEDAELALDTGESIEIPDWLRDLKQDEIPPVPAGYTRDQEIEEGLEEDTLEQVKEDSSESELEVPVGKIALGAAAGIVAAIYDEEKHTDQEMDEALPDSDGELPDYLEVSDSIESEEQPAIVPEAVDEIPEWLKEPDAEPSADQPEILSPEDRIEPSRVLEDEDIRDTAEQLTEEKDVSVTEITPQLEPEPVVPEQEDMLVAPSEIEEELLPASQKETIETKTPPDMEEIAPEIDEETYALAPEDETPATLKDDEAFAWLEGLALKQGVEEAMLLSSDEHIDEPPDWVQAEATELSVESVEESSQLDQEEDLYESVAPESEGGAEELPEWLMGIQPSDEDVAEPSYAESTEIPDWLKQAEISSSKPGESGGDELDDLQEAMSAEDIPDWLKSTAAIAGVMSAAASRDEDAPSDAKDSFDEGDVAEWLSQSQADTLEPVEAYDSEESWEVPETPVVEESTITDEDTKPIRVMPADEVPIPPTTTITSPEEPVETSLDDELLPEAQDEGLPDWIQDLSEELELSTDTLEPIDEAETSIEEDAEWVPELQTDEILIEEGAETVAAAAEIEEDRSLAEDEIKTTESLEDEDAFAWLEGLAAKHGAEEAMLLEPEDRQETPPEWVLAEAEAEDTTIIPEHAEEVIYEVDQGEGSDTLLEGETLEVEDIYQEVQITPIVSEEELILEEVAEVATDEEAISEPESELSDLETSFEECVAEGEAEIDETQPELPPWLAGVEEESAISETPEWIVSTEESEAQEVQQEEVELTSTLVDLNQAGLVELERLPGVGFIKAQAIIEYRESVGPFMEVEDLQNVSGIGPALIEEIRELIVVDIPEDEIADLPTDEHQVTLIQARNAFIEGDINTSLEHYNKLIQSQHMLGEVIQDLHEALYRYPVDVGIWQSLGDAFMRSGQIQDALDAYTKAEELLR